ncbi:MAG TPA: hypothetical protein VN328_09675 [Thermodesulfovibrionales bacterium]|nr:hypothetical protein [Thermodesulfovibrionales bacterium]
MIENRIDIVKTIKAGNYHSSFILCYSFDLAFYESIMLSSLRSIGCRNNALIVDDEKYQESLDVLSGLIAHAGQLYSITPISTRGSFHPKLILLLGDQEIALFIGTGNASLGGYSRNREIFFYLKADNSEDGALRLILEAWHFIKLVIGGRPQFITSQIEMAEYETPLLTVARGKAIGLADIVDFPDGTRAALLTTKTKESLLYQYSSLAGEAKAQSLTVISPFFDSGIRTIKSLIDTFDPKVVNVIVQPDSVNIYVKAIKTLRDKRIKLFSFRSPFQRVAADSEPYLHAKGIFLQSKDGEHSLLGSANVTFSALGALKAPGMNTEACLYVFHPKKNQLLNVLGICESLKDDALVSKEQLSLIKWKKIDKSRSGTTVPSLLGIEYASDRLIAYCGDSLTPDLSWNIELLDKNNISLGFCKAHAVSASTISFLCDHRLIDKAVKGRVVIGKREKTKIYIIHHIAPLSHNSPNFQTRKAWEVIESIQLDSDDLTDLIEPFEQLLFYNPQLRRHQAGGKSQEQTEGNKVESGTPGDEKKVPYGEFVCEASKHKFKEAYSLISESSALGLLIEFLLSRIGYRDKKDLTHEDKDLPETIYDEEDLLESSEGSEKTDKKEGTQAKKKTVVSQDQFEWQQRRLYKLADRYYEYLDDLLSEDVNKRLDPIEVVKFFAAMLLLLHFADKKISLSRKGRIEKKIMFPLYDEDEYDFLYYGYEITSKFFAVAPNPIIERIALPHHLQSMPDDMVSSIGIGAYVLIVLLLIGEKHNYDALKDIEIAAARLYINSGIAKGVIDQLTMEKLFEGFHGQAGYKNKITIEKVLEKHLEIANNAKKYDRQIDKAKKLFNDKEALLRDRKFAFPAVIAGDIVWNKRSGFGIVRRIEDSDRVIVTNPGDKYKKNDEEIFDETRISQGNLIKLQ